MFYDLGKKIFYFVINSVRFVQVTLVFLAFFVTLYWIFQIAGATFLTPVAPFFESIKAAVHVFYNRTVAIDQVSIDFSFLLASFVYLIIAHLLKFLAEWLEKVEKNYDDMHKYLKQQVENTFNENLKRQHIAQEKLNSKFLMIVQFNLKNLMRDKFFHHDLNEGMDEKQKEVLKDFSEIFGKEFVTKKDFINEGLLLYLSNFENMERLVSEFSKSISTIQQKYSEQHWQVNYIAAIDVYATVGEVTTKFKKLVMLMNLGLKNKITCLSTFKQRYLIEKNPVYSVEEYGTYKLYDYEDIYIIENLI